MWLDIAGLRSAEREQSFKMALDLAKPAPGEDENLELHSEICARRFSALVDLLKAQYDQSRANRGLTFVVIALLIATRVLPLDAIAAALTAAL